MSRHRIPPIRIYMLLPKRNCGKCGVPTCMAFAVKLSSREVSPDLCPFLSPQAKTQLYSMVMPPIRPVKIVGRNLSVEVGGEEGLFRHEGGFRREARVAYPLNLGLDQKLVAEEVKLAKSVTVARMGATLSIELYSADLREAAPEEAVEKLTLLRRLTGEPLILESPSLKTCEAALTVLEGEKPALYVEASSPDLKTYLNLAYDKGLPLILASKSLGEAEKVLASLDTERIPSLILGFKFEDPRKFAEYAYRARSKALEGDVRFRYPILADLRMLPPSFDAVLSVSLSLLRYASIVILPWKLDREALEAILVFKQSLYTDPKSPKTVEARLYRIGAPSPCSPILVTCNYALTFHIVKTELERSKVDCWLLAIDTGGLSVASALGGDKLTASRIAEALAEASGRVNLSKAYIVLPGVAARLVAELEARGYRVVAGPRKARGLTDFLRKLTAST